MEFLTKWFIEAPENTVLAGEPTFDFREPIWWLAVVLISFMTCAVLLLYALERGTLGWIRRGLLIVIRLALLVLVLLLIFRPVLVADFKGERTRHIVVLVDASLSMTQQDRRIASVDILRVAIARGLLPLDTKLDETRLDDSDELKTLADQFKSNTGLPSRIDIVKSILNHKELKPGADKKARELNLIENLSKKGALQIWEFGDKLKNLNQEGSKDVKELNDRIANLKPNYTRTALHDSVNTILQRKDGDMPAAIFIITDGQDNASKLQRRDVTDLCKANGVPLYIYGVGSAQAPVFQIKEVITPDTLFIKDTSVIPVYWKSMGLTKGTVEIALRVARKKPVKDPKDPSKYQTEVDQNGKPILDIYNRPVVKYDWEFEKDEDGQLKKDKNGEPIIKYVPVKDKDNKDIVKKLPMKEGLDLREFLMFPVPELQELLPQEKPPADSKKEPKARVEVQKFQLTMKLLDNEDYKDLGDTVVREVRVTDRKVKVLVIENSPRFEFKFLQTALDPDRERRFETTFFLTNADEKVTRPKIKATPEEMRKKPYIKALPDEKEFKDAEFDVILLGDVSPEVLGQQRMEWIKKFVSEDRGGLILLAGRQNMPIKYWADRKEKDDKKKNPLFDLLPIDFDSKKLGLEERPEEYKPTLTDVGQRTEMLYLADSIEENLKIWEEQLPGFYWQFPATKLRPGAISLVVNPRVKMAGNQNMPVVATQLYGTGQVLYCGTDETWRWRGNVRDGEADKFFVRYWGQILYQMGLPHLIVKIGGNRIIFTQGQSESTLDKEAYVYIRALKDDFTPREDPQIEAALVQIDGTGPRTEKPLIFHPETGFDGKPIKGKYRALLPNKEVGKFEIRLKKMDKEYSFTYRVEPPPRHEMDTLGLADKELRDLAKDSGGEFYREEDLHHLLPMPKGVKDKLAPLISSGKEFDTRSLFVAELDKIFKDEPQLLKKYQERIVARAATGEKYKLTEDCVDGDVKQRKVEFHIRQEVVLWNTLAMVLFIVLITTEWVLRKFSNLS